MEDKKLKAAIESEKDRAKKVLHGHPKFFKLLEEIGELHDKKNAQYASTERPLGNFERCSQMCKALFHPDIQADPYRLQMAYAFVLVSKQIDGAIEILAHDKQDTVDTLEEKVRDVITYFGIIDCIDNDRREEQSHNKQMEREASDDFKVSKDPGIIGVNRS